MVSSFQSSEPFECIIFLFHNNEDFLPRKRIFPVKYINSVFPPCLLFFPNFCNQYCLWASARETLALTLCMGAPPLSPRLLWDTTQPCPAGVCICQLDQTAVTWTLEFFNRQLQMHTRVCRSFLSSSSSWGQTKPLAYLATEWPKAHRLQTEWTELGSTD